MKAPLWCVLRVNYENGTSEPISRDLSEEEAKEISRDLVSHAAEVLGANASHLDYYPWPESEMPHCWMGAQHP